MLFFRQRVCDPKTALTIAFRELQIDMLADRPNWTVGKDPKVSMLDNGQGPVRLLRFRWPFRPN